MRTRFSVLICLSILLINMPVFAQNEPFTIRTVNTSYQLNSAWEILYGPDDSLWVTENAAYKISRIDPASGGKTELLDISGNKNFDGSISKWPQGGLMGMALHPSMYNEWPNPSKPYVYIAYVYKYNQTASCDDNTGPCNFNTRIARYIYNRGTHTLTNETILIESLTGSNDHNSGRLAIGKVGGNDFLFYTIGDMGAGQFNNASRTNHAQSQNVLEGKVLRFNLEADGDVNQWDRWIPNDNPFPATGTKNAVWSMGHRNAQGIVFSSNGVLYSSEQQDRSDDEINIIEKTNNYGWPKVSGFCDGNYTGQTLAGQPVGDEIANCNTYNVREPIYTLFTDPAPGALGSNYMSWPTVACSSIDVYEQDVIPGWSKSLLVPGLKAGQVYRLSLSADGKTILDSSTIPAMRNLGRYRDIAIAPDGLKIYVSCDMSGNYILPNGTQSAGAGPNAGRILEFTYTGKVMAIDDTKNSHTRNTEIKIFPNPVVDILQVRSIKSIQKPLFYYVYDMSGKLVLTGKSQTDYFDIKLGKLHSGLYIFKIYNSIGMNLFTDKVIIR